MQTLLKTIVALRGALARAGRWAGTWGPRRPFYVFGAAIMVAVTTVAAAPGNSLLDASERGDRAAALRLLANGADPNTPGPDGTTAVMYAAANDDVELVRALIKAGANVKLKNQFGTSAITEAAIIGSTPIIDALLKAGADANTKNPEGETPLSFGTPPRSESRRSSAATARPA